MDAIKFYIPSEMETTIGKQRDEIKRLKEELACAKKDIKRLMIHDYDVVCEFCSKNKCCYTLNGYDCRDRCNWKGV